MSRRAALPPVELGLADYFDEQRRELAGRYSWVVIPIRFKDDLLRAKPDYLALARELIQEMESALSDRDLRNPRRQLSFTEMVVFTEDLEALKGAVAAGDTETTHTLSVGLLMGGTFKTDAYRAGRTTFAGYESLLEMQQSSVARLEAHVVERYSALLQQVKGAGPLEPGQEQAWRQFVLGYDSTRAAAARADAEGTFPQLDAPSSSDLENLARFLELRPQATIAFEATGLVVQAGTSISDTFA